MKNILQDWIKYCEKQETFEKGHFYTLMMDEITEDEVAIIYKYLPNTKKLLLKTMKYLHYRRTPNNEVVNLELLKILIKLDFEERTTIFNNLGDFSEFNIKKQFQFTEDTHSISEMAFDDIISQQFYSYSAAQKIQKDDNIYMIYDTLYGLTNDFDDRLYLFEPLLTINYTGEYLFQFKRFGGIYAIQDNTVFFSIEK